MMSSPDFDTLVMRADFARQARQRQTDRRDVRNL
jgi:hypothetical protein